jgi:hypothetical protein
MAYIIVNENHIINQIVQRYKLEIEYAKSILKEIVATLKQQAPDDWRFTISPSARFFVVHLPSQVKILGFSYKEAGADIVRAIQKSIKNNTIHNINLDRFVNMYLEALNNSNLKIIHHLRTAYPKEKGEIGEEKRIISSLKRELSHIILFQEKKFSSRPNALIIQGQLWVRQQYNWIDMRNYNKEYFLFKQLTPEGIDETKRKIFSYSVNGDIKEETDLSGCPYCPSCHLPIKKLESFINFRTESYWSLPTYIDRRLLDLEFRERSADKTEEGPLNKDEILELYFLRNLIEKVRRKIYKI